MQGGKSGASFVPGDSLASLLVHLVAGVEEDRRMPEGSDPLSDGEIGLLRAWIDQGAKWPDGADVTDPRLDRARKHWSFQRLRTVSLPKKKAADTWPKSTVDLFVFAKLSEHGLSPSQPASARTLVRWIYFDLSGVPPRPEKTSQFVAAHAIDPVTATSSLLACLLDWLEAVADFCQSLFGLNEFIYVE